MGQPNLRHIANICRRDYQRGAESEVRWFAIQPDLSTALKIAAFAIKPGGKRFSHQRRIPRSMLAKAHRALSGVAPSLRHLDDFEAIHNLVESTVRPIHGLGELYVYDTALRIGAYLGVLPSRVYVHAGVRKGAQRLGFQRGCRTIGLSQLPLAFRQFAPYQVEDILCIFKDDLSLRRRSVATIGNRSMC